MHSTLYTMSNTYHKYIKYKTKYINLKNESNASQTGGNKIQDNSYIVTYPSASNFLSWLLPKLRKNKIPYKNPDTGGDFSKTFVGKDKKGVMMDWKHLDAYDIDQFNKQINAYGYHVTYYPIEGIGNYVVQFCKLDKKPK